MSQRERDKERKEVKERVREPERDKLERERKREREIIEISRLKRVCDYNYFDEFISCHLVVNWKILKQLKIDRSDLKQKVQVIINFLPDQTKMS